MNATQTFADRINENPEILANILIGIVIFTMLLMFMIGVISTIMRRKPEEIIIKIIGFPITIIINTILNIKGNIRRMETTKSTKLDWLKLTGTITLILLISTITIQNLTFNTQTNHACKEISKNKTLINIKTDIYPSYTKTCVYEGTGTHEEINIQIKRVKIT